MVFGLSQTTTSNKKTISQLLGETRYLHHR